MSSSDRRRSRARRFSLVGATCVLFVAVGCPSEQEPAGADASVVEDTAVDGHVDTSAAADSESSDPEDTTVVADSRNDTGSTTSDTPSADDTGDSGSASLCDRVKLGDNADLGDVQLFPQGNYWNKSVENAPVDPNSDALIKSMGADTGLHPDFGCCWMNDTFGIPYTVVDGSTSDVPVSFRYADESDPGPYPIPKGAPIEGGKNATGDRHVLVLDCADRKLYEIFDAHPQNDGSWMAGSGSVWNLDESPVREAYCTSADAAGLPILPGLARYQEAAAGKIDHALRFTVADTRKAFVRPPASHWASSKTDTNLPPLGMRVRLKSDAELKAAGVNVQSFHPQVRAIVDALQTYGMILADNGSDWYVSGAPHSKWKDGKLVGQLGEIKGKHFEVIEMDNVIDDRSLGSGSCKLSGN